MMGIHDSNQCSSVGGAFTWSHTVRQKHDRSQSQAPPMLVHKYVDENGGQEVSHQRGMYINMPPPSTNKAAHSGIDTQIIPHEKSKTGLPVATQKERVHQKYFKK